MKPKFLNKGLVLKRETIVNLSETALGALVGGFKQTDRTCNPSCDECPISYPLSECECPSTYPGC